MTRARAAVFAAALTCAAAAAACTSSGGSAPTTLSAASGRPSVGASASGSSAAGASASGASASGSSAGPSASGSAPGPGGTTVSLPSARPASSTAPTSVPVVVPTGTKAPYPTPGNGPASHDQGALLDTLPGSASGACVRVGNNADVRSGGIGAGDFVSARSQYRTSADRTVSLSIVPRHTAHLTRARIVVDPQGPGATRTVTSQAAQEGDANQYFDAVVPIATAGTYRLTITSGNDRGCFVVTFSR